jgi:hypothetical protein
MLLLADLKEWGGSASSRCAGPRRGKDELVGSGVFGDSMSWVYKLILTGRIGRYLELFISGWMGGRWDACFFAFLARVERRIYRGAMANGEQHIIAADQLWPSRQDLPMPMEVLSAEDSEPLHSRF